jgi:hypothetical protein
MGIAQLYFGLALWALPIGMMLGVVLGAAEGLALRSIAIALRGALIGLLIGAVGGVIGVVIAQTVYGMIAGCLFFGRGIGWSIFGLCIGLSEGVRRFSLIGARNAALGGWLGGFIGGVMFDFVGLIIRWDVASRFIALVILGACIGILIALVETVLAHGALRVLAGRQEGREILLDKSRLVIGRDERNDIYLSDRGIETRHAELRAERGTFAIVPASGAVSVNGNPITHHLLQPGDVIELGAARLRYRARGETSPRTPPRADQPAPVTRACSRCAHPNRVEARFCARCGQRM